MSSSSPSSSIARAPGLTLLPEPRQGPLAELRRVSKVYGEGESRVMALDDLSLSIHQGDYLAVMGASGSGKSTAMSILGCLDRPTSGS